MSFERRVETWGEFNAAIDRLSVRAGAGLRWLFRGQADAAWSLQPSLTRILERFKVPVSQAVEAERIARGRFLTRAPELLPDAMARALGDEISTWISMQHYGAPTRLLDWTASPYVAAYFAVEQLTDTDAAVWVLAMRVFWAAGWDRAPARKDIVTFISPVVMTDRMAAQQTHFTVSPDIFADHAALIRALPPAAMKEAEFKGLPAWLKIVIPAARKVEFLSHLRQMNLTAESLFPGLDGLGRGVRELLWDHLDLFGSPPPPGATP